MLGHAIEFLHQLALDALGLVLAVLCGAAQPASSVSPPAQPEAAGRTVAVETQAALADSERSRTGDCLQRLIAFA